MRVMRAMRVLPLWVAILCGGQAGCFGLPGNNQSDGGNQTELRGPAGAWTWVDVAGTVCDDGTPTGIAINPSPSGGSDLLIYFLGGGACWDYQTCAVANTSSHGPYGRAQFEPGKSGFNGTALDRSIPGNAFSDYNMVFVPYCTGDLHAGDNIATYESAGQKRVIHHKGRANILSFLPRVAATWPQLRKLVISGSSAGGFGSTLNYDLMRTTWPEAKGYLVDDSGPSLSGNAVPKILRDAWYTQWSLSRTVGPTCPGCQDDFSLIYPALAGKYPADRFSLLSYTQDQVIRAYLGGVPGAQFQTSLYQLATGRFDGSPQSRVFFVTGDSHVLLTTPSATSKGVSLLKFLALQVTDDAAWASVRP